VLPGDMLSSTEQQEAVDAALDSDQVASVVAAAVDRDTLVTSTAAGATVSDVTALAELGGKPSYRVVYVERMADKGSAARRAEVMIYRYDTAQPLLVGVDLATGATEELDFASVGQVPLVPSEIAEAAAIARADDSVRQALEAAGLALQSPATVIVAVSADAADRCAMHRCVRVFFSTLRMPAPTFSAVVDMADLEIVQVEPIPTGEGES
jgi:enamine deaminase RidA (YjgF/YER057c/UK114 family)